MIEKEILCLINEITSKEYNINDILDLDSISFIKLVVALECEFDFEFEEEKLIITNYPRVKDIIKYVISNGNFQ